MSRWAATRLQNPVPHNKPLLTNPLTTNMSDTTRKPLPPALKVLKPILDTLPLEEDSEGETEVVNVKDFTVRALCVL